jgi:hypothetical protein
MIAQACKETFPLGKILSRVLLSHSLRTCAGVPSKCFGAMALSAKRDRARILELLALRLLIGCPTQGLEQTPDYLAWHKARKELQREAIERSLGSLGR